MADSQYMVLARKWRPRKFEDVVGQEHITRTLQNAIGAGRIGHAFLFVGSRGIGKTTTARILAKALNCLAVDEPTASPCCECTNCVSIAAGTNIDVIEIDGASNNGVDDVREIREHIRLVPANSRYKIYTIDEVHQLSPAAFNALLKTLEEPPAHAVFILATTEAHRIPATIISRCQRYDFRRVGIDRICDLLKAILNAEGVECTDEALHAIARAADGGIRDSESILDQLVSYCDNGITFQDVSDVLGLVDWKMLHELCNAISTKDIATELRIVDDVVVAGKDLSQFVQEILGYFRNLLVCKTMEQPERLLALPEDEIDKLREHAGKLPLTGIINLVEQFAEVAKGFDSQQAQRIALEALLIRVSKVSVEVSVDSVLEKLMQLGLGGVSDAGPAAANGGDDDSDPSNGADGSTKRSSQKNKSQGQSQHKQNAAERGKNSPTTTSRSTLGGIWESAAGELSRENLNLAIQMGNATPVRIQDGELVLNVEKKQIEARCALEDTENKQRITQVLALKREDIKGIRTDVVETAAGSEPQEDETSSRVIAHSEVDEEKTRAALGNPAIAKVVDVFKGRIVGVRRGVDWGHQSAG